MAEATVQVQENPQTMNSHLTAISRKALPVPVRWLLSQGLIHGHVLDYGCGKCEQVNTQLLNTAPGIASVTSYDPHFAPDGITKAGRLGWDVILCTYVLCTLPQSEETSILKAVQTHLRPNGVAYISVRNDVPKGGYGVSSKKTLQRKVDLPYLYEFRRCHQYRTYLLTAGTFLA
jgi:hypothetical protein